MQPFTFTILLNDAVYSTGNSFSETLALLAAFPATSDMTVQLDGPR